MDPRCLTDLQRVTEGHRVDPTRHTDLHIIKKITWWIYNVLQAGQKHSRVTEQYTSPEYGVQYVFLDIIRNMKCVIGLSIFTF